MPTTWKRSIAMILAATGVFPSFASALTIVNGYSTTVDDRFTSGYPLTPVANSSPLFIGSGYDLSGVGWSPSDTTQSGALLSPRHVLESIHHPFGANGDWSVAFVAPNSTTPLTTAVASSTAITGASTFDIQIGTLVAPVPSVAVYSILDLGPNGDYTGSPLIMYGHGGPSPRVGWNSVIGAESGSLGNQLFFNISGAQPNMAVPESGDSQSPLFIPWNNPVTGAAALTLIGAQWTTEYSTFIADPALYEQINSVLTPTGYALRWTPAAIATAWQGGISSNWGIAGNWSAGLPYASSYILFDGNVTAAASARNVNLAADRAVVGIYFKAAPPGRPFTLAAGSVLTLGRGGIVNYDSATQTINTTMMFADHQNWFAGSGGLAINGTLINNGYLLYINTTGNSTLAGLMIGTGGLAKDGAGTLTITSSQLFTGRVFAHAGVLNVAHPTGLAAGNLTLDPGATVRYSQLPTQGAVISSLTLAAGATLDVNSAVVLPSANAAAGDALFATLQGALASGRAGGAWTGTGLTSSAAAAGDAGKGANGIFALGLVRSSDLPGLYNTTTRQFAGVGVLPTAVLLKYTYVGDTNLDGVINIDDYLRLDSAYLRNKPALWANGDFNYDGTINYKDYALMDAAYLAQSGPLALPEIQQHAAMFGAEYLDTLAAVPEPGTLMLLAGGMLLVQRRRGGAPRSSRPA